MTACHGFQRASKGVGKGLDAFIIFHFTFLLRKKREKMSFKAAFLKQTSMFSMEDSGTMMFMIGSVLC